MKVILSAALLMVAFVLAIAAPYLATDRPNPDLAYKALSAGAGMLTLVGIVALINSTRKRVITPALDLAVRFGGSDEIRHLKWVIDQMVRELTNCTRNPDGTIVESEEYKKLVRNACNGPEGPHSYEWEKVLHLDWLR